jgi:hypothetical protein
MNWTEWIVMSERFNLLADIRIGLDAEGHWTMVLVPDQGLPSILSGDASMTATELLHQFVGVIRSREHAESSSSD